VCAVHPHFDFVFPGDAHAARNSLSHLAYRYFLRTPPLCSTFVMRHRSQGVNQGTGGYGFWNLPTCPCPEYYILFAASAVTRIPQRWVSGLPECLLYSSTLIDTRGIDPGRIVADGTTGRFGESWWLFPRAKVIDRRKQKASDALATACLCSRKR